MESATSDTHASRTLSVTTAELMKETTSSNVAPEDVHGLFEDFQGGIKETVMRRVCIWVGLEALLVNGHVALCELDARHYSKNTCITNEV